MTKPSAIKVGIWIDTERSYGYFHVIGKPCIIGPTQFDLEAIDRGETRHVDAERVTFFDSYDRPDGLRLDHLRFTSQGTDDDTNRFLYAWHIEYRDITLRYVQDAEAHARTLKTIDRKLEKLANEYGRPTTFGQHLLRIAKAIGAKAFVLPSKHNDPNRFYANRSYRIEDLKTGAYWVDTRVNEWVNERAKEKEQAS